MKRFVNFFTWIMIASSWPMATLQFGDAQADKPQPAENMIDHDALVEDQRLAYNFWVYCTARGFEEASSK